MVVVPLTLPFDCVKVREPLGAYKPEDIPVSALPSPLNELPVIVPLAVIAPVTSSATVGDALLMPTRSFVESTFSVSVSTVRSALSVALPLASMSRPELALSCWKVSALIVPISTRSLRSDNDVCCR